MDGCVEGVKVIDYVFLFKVGSFVLLLFKLYISIYNYFMILFYNGKKNREEGERGRGEEEERR